MTCEIVERKGGTVVKEKKALDDQKEEQKKLVLLELKRQKEEEDRDTGLDEKERQLKGLAGGLLAFIYFGYYSGYSSIFGKFLKMSNLVDVDRYGICKEDIFYCANIVLTMLYVRAQFGLNIGRPLARKFKTLDTAKKRARFSEQLWGVAMALASFTYGMVIIITYPEFFGHVEMWSTYPVLQMPFAIKFYYLYETAFWISTLVYLNIEQGRKDWMIMTIHHIFTIGLLVSSYYVHLTSIGLLIHVTMDVADIFLPTAKIFKYLDMEKCTNIAFVFVVISWIYSRHFVFLRIIFDSVYMSEKYIDKRWDPQNGYYYTENIKWLLVASLCILEILFCMWLASMLRIIYDAIRGKEINDIRSDDED
ncbi:Sphingosine N-acyltransferase lag1 [Zancudomyces culisetae]|uniref:Sphingosine N-acyltransferase lag1 n=1 Tax=Zancudomyces culisetae TaxID=1213189 RepID=A0A1R1PY92_ZANCU|nr:Sphingosine N-acyltransferase lag1 [Zancudomyces culisetae]|eukprot:OMH85935.1 Sphingosine N-acyltransferase lag1 [Zancudomyces culisetae]